MRPIEKQSSSVLEMEPTSATTLRLAESPLKNAL
jgi:hypothetical protein